MKKTKPRHFVSQWDLESLGADFFPKGKVPTLEGVAASLAKSRGETAPTTKKGARRYIARYLEECARQYARQWANVDPLLLVNRKPERITVESYDLAMSHIRSILRES